MLQVRALLPSGWTIRSVCQVDRAPIRRGARARALRRPRALILPRIVARRPGAEAIFRLTLRRRATRRSRTASFTGSTAAARRGIFFPPHLHGSRFILLAPRAPPPHATRTALTVPPPSRRFPTLSRGRTDANPRDANAEARHRARRARLVRWRPERKTPRSHTCASRRRRRETVPATTGQTRPKIRRETRPLRRRRGARGAAAGGSSRQRRRPSARSIASEIPTPSWLIAACRSTARDRDERWGADPSNRLEPTPRNASNRSVERNFTPTPAPRRSNPESVGFEL